MYKNKLARILQTLIYKLSKGKNFHPHRLGSIVRRLGLPLPRPRPRSASPPARSSLPSSSASDVTDTSLLSSCCCSCGDVRCSYEWSLNADAMAARFPPRMLSCTRRQTQSTVTSAITYVWCISKKKRREPRCLRRGNQRFI